MKVKVEVKTQKEIGVEELVTVLGEKEKSCIDQQGRMGSYTQVNKQLLADAAAVIVTLAKEVTELRHTLDALVDNLSSDDLSEIMSKLGMGKHE